MLTYQITPFLWFNDKAEEAVALYTSIFPNSKILRTSPGPNGKPMTVNFLLDGQEFIALNGGPQFKFTEAISLLVTCETQTEVDDLWSKLMGGGGQESQCGWLKDKYGLSWQVIPTLLPKLLSDPDRAKAGRVMTAMLKMRKIDMGALEKAAAGN